MWWHYSTMQTFIELIEKWKHWAPSWYFSFKSIISEMYLVGRPHLRKIIERIEAIWGMP